MSEPGIHAAELILLLLLLFVVVFAAVAQKLRTPYPIVLVVAGLLLGFVPGIPKIELDPDIIFLVVLPPLLYSAAWVTSWRDLSRNLVSVVMLAVGLVGFTVAAVTQVGPWLFAGFDWRAGFVLGAAVATTDAIAATSVAKRIGLPKGITDLLEGESLINDATGLLALEFATMIVVDGQHPTVTSGVLRLIYLSVAAIGAGLLLGRIVEWLGSKIQDGPMQIAVSILTPYAAYLAAEAIHASGVLAVVVAGLYVGERSSRVLSPRVRLQKRAVWDSITFILNGLVFVLIGLQLRSVLQGVSEISTQKVILYGGLFSVLLIVIRLLWIYPGMYVAHLIRTRLLRQKVAWPGAGQVFVAGWTGMRGVIALAAAMSLPVVTASGSPFPHRDLIVFLTFSVILVTLVFQGLTLPPLIRLLGLAGSEGPKCGEQEARRLVLEATIAQLEDVRRSDTAGIDALYDDLARHYEHRLASMNGGRAEQSAESVGHYSRYLEISREFLDVERSNALRLRNEGRITDEMLREMEHEMDLDEARLTAALEGHSGELVGSGSVHN
jgi:monovalent cation/hydrogen antiporter